MSDTDSATAANGGNPDNVQGDFQDINFEDTDIKDIDFEDPRYRAYLKQLDIATLYWEIIVLKLRLLVYHGEFHYDLFYLVTKFLSEKIGNWLVKASKLEHLNYNALLLFATSAVDIQLRMMCAYLDISIFTIKLDKELIKKDFTHPYGQALLTMLLLLDINLFIIKQVVMFVVFPYVITSKLRKIINVILKVNQPRRTKARESAERAVLLFSSSAPVFAQSFCDRALRAAFSIILLQTGYDMVRVAKTISYGRYHSRALVNFALLLATSLIVSLTMFLFDFKKVVGQNCELESSRAALDDSVEFSALRLAVWLMVSLAMLFFDIEKVVEQNRELETNEAALDAGGD